VSFGPEIEAAAIGALLVWVFQLFDKIRDRRRRRQSTLVALASEVQAICNLIRSQGYLEAFDRLANQIRAKSWDGTGYVIDIRGNYFQVFQSTAGHLSDLRPEEVAKIVAFYTYCQSAIDSTRPDGPAATSDDLEDKASNIIGVEGVLTAVLALGDQIVGLPKEPLPLLPNQ
jgi:hypothetical protein